MATTPTFKEAFGVLQKHAQTLREQKEPNIDELLDVVTESVAAYKICKERIDAVDKALQEALTKADLGEGNAPSAIKARPGAGGAEPEDEVSF